MNRDFLFITSTCFLSMLLLQRLIWYYSFSSPIPSVPVSSVLLSLPTVQPSVPSASLLFSLTSLSTLFRLYYSMIVATRPDPTAHPPSRNKKKESRVSYCEIPLRKSYIMMLGSKAFDPSDTGLLRTTCSRNPQKHS